PLQFDAGLQGLASGSGIEQVVDRAKTSRVLRCLQGKQGIYPALIKDAQVATRLTLQTDRIEKGCGDLRGGWQHRSGSDFTIEHGLAGFVLRPTFVAKGELYRLRRADD